MIHGDRRSGWFRLWRNGPGLSWKPADAPRLFSDRMGKTRTYVVGRTRFRFLRSTRPAPPGPLCPKCSSTRWHYVPLGSSGSYCCDSCKFMSWS